MKKNEKLRALIDAYIEVCREHHYDDSAIIDALTDIFDEEELAELGYGNFVHEYFAEDTEVKNDENDD